MATGKRCYWMKLKENFITSATIDYFMSQPDGANYIVLYQMLCLKTINTNGRLSRQVGEVVIKYDISKIQRDFKWFSADTIRVALNLYKMFGLVYEDIDGTLVLTDHSNLVGSETDYKAQKAKQRIESKDRPRLLNSCKRVNANTILLPSGSTQYVDEKRYGGNGMLAFDLASGACEMCGAQDDLVIHHNNGYSNDIEDLYILCRHCHGIAHTEIGKSQLHHNRCGQEGGQVHIEIENRDRDKETRDKSKEIEEVPNGTSCAEPKKSDSTPPVISLILNDKSFFDVTDEDVARWSELYPAVDVMQELRKMAGWCESNTTKRKTRRGVRAFITSWLAKAQDRGGSQCNVRNANQSLRESSSSNPFLREDI